MNNKTLFLIFLVLLIIYGLTRLFPDRKESSFDSELIAVDTVAVSMISIDPKGPESTEFTLKREASGWIATNGVINVKASSSSINSLLGNLLLIRTKRIAAKDPGQWSEYEVAEEQATRIRIYQDENVLEDFLVGRFSFNPQAQTGVSYIRLTDRDEVYAVDGFQTLSLGQGFEAYRDRSFMQLQATAEVLSLDYLDRDSSYLIAKTGGQWILNQDIPLDSAAVSSFVDGLRQVSGDEFADNFDEVGASGLPSRRLTLSGTGIDPPIIITGYRDSSRTLPFVLHSSQRPDTYFASDSSGLFQRVFPSIKDWSSVESIE